MQGQGNLGFEAGNLRRVGESAAPFTFAVHDEGRGLSGLYLAPCALADLRSGLEALDLGTLVEISPRWGVRADHALPIHRLAARTGPIELVTAPGDDLPDSVLADPHAAVARGRRLAITISDDGHALLYASDRAVHEALLVSWLAARLSEAGLEPADAPPEALDTLLDPLPDDAWHEIGVEAHRRFQVLRIATRTVDEGGASLLSESRWVGGSGRAWRDGWSW